MAKKFLFLLAIFFLASSAVFYLPSVRADGCFFPNMEYYAEDIAEPTQKGIIFFNGTDERLILEAAYKGNLSGFAWVIPVPSYPKVNKSSSALFEYFHDMTMPNVMHVTPLFFLTAAGTLSSFGSVYMHERKQVGIYDISVLSTTNSSSLVKWLDDNGYKMPRDAVGVMEFYRKKNWYFIAARINLRPYDEKLLDILRKIDPSITNMDDAVTKLANDIAGYIKEKKNYDNLTAIKENSLEYGDEGNGYYGNPLISHYSYYDIYERYNGYTENHIKNEITSQIGDFFYKKYLPKMKIQ